MLGKRLYFVTLNDVLYRFRSPFGDPNISLSPIPKSKLFPSANDNEHLPEEEPNAVRNLNFETTSNFDSDLDETALDYQTKKNQVKPNLILLPSVTSNVIND